MGVACAKYAEEEQIGVEDGNTPWLPPSNPAMIEQLQVCPVVGILGCPADVPDHPLPQRMKWFAFFALGYFTPHSTSSILTHLCQAQQKFSIRP